MSDASWRALVQKWSDPKNKKERYKDQEPNAVDLFKECHNSKKKGFSESVQQAIADMESMMDHSSQDNLTPKSSTEIVRTILTSNSANSSFLKNVGLESSTNRSQLRKQLQLERERAAALQQTIDSQQHELNFLKNKAQAVDEAMLKQHEDMDEFKKNQAEKYEELQKKQEENDAILRRLLRLSQVNS